MDKTKNNIILSEVCFPPLFFYVYRNNASPELNESALLNSIPMHSSSEVSFEYLETRMEGTSWLCKGSEWDYINIHLKHYYEYHYLLNFGTDHQGTLKCEKQDTCYVYDLATGKWQVSHHSTTPLYTFNYKATSPSTIQWTHYAGKKPSAIDSTKTISKITNQSLYVDFMGKYFTKEQFLNCFTLKGASKNWVAVIDLSETKQEI